MNVALERRVERLEERGAIWQPAAFDLAKKHGTLELAKIVLHGLRLGAGAKTELDADDGSLSPERRAELTKTLEAAREVVKGLRESRTEAVAPPPPPPNEETTQWLQQ